MRVGFRRRGFQGVLPFFPSSTLNLRFTAGVGVGISGACEPPLVWRARKPLPWALRSSAALALGLAMPRAPATELVFWHRVSDCAPKGCGLLFSFLFLFYLFVLSALACFDCCFEVTVTSISLPPFVSRRGFSNANLGNIRCFGHRNLILATS